MATKNINIDILAKDKTVKAMQSATKNVNNLKNNVQSSVAHQKRSFTSLGSTIKLVLGTLAVVETVRFANQMVMMTSAVEEMQSKSSVVFGQFVNSVRKELEKFGDQVGRSTFELEQMASSIQDTFVPMGFARGEASKLSVQLTKLAVDVASFNNASDVETMMAFQSALVGNHETVRRFGVVITEATLKQELLRMGINKASKDVTNAEKVQARLNLIIAGTADAHNDAINTSGSFANSMKALNAEFQEFMVEAINPLLPQLANMLRSLKDNIIETKEFLRAIGLLKKMNEIVPIVDQLQKNTDKLAIAERKLAEETKLLDAIQNTTFLEKTQEMVKANGEFGMSIMTGEKAVLKRIEALKLEIEQIKKNKELIILDSDARIKNANALKDQNKETDKTTKALKNLDNVTRDAIFGVDDFAIKFEKANDKIALIHSLDHFGEIKRQAEPLVTVLTQTERAFIDVAKSATDRMADSLTNLVKGTVSAKDAFRDMANSIISDLIRMAVKKYVTDQIFGFATRAISTAFGAPIVASNVEGGAVVGARANGGSVMAGKPYMVGEKGAELFVPNRSGNIVPNHELGKGGTPIVVNQTINLSTGVAQTVRAEVLNMLPQIAESTKGAVLDAKRRGGNFSSAFGV